MATRAEGEEPDRDTGPIVTKPVVPHSEEHYCERYSFTLVSEEECQYCPYRQRRRRRRDSGGGGVQYWRRDQKARSRIVFSLNDEEETIVSDEESQLTTRRRRPLLTTLHKISNHNYQADILSFFLSMQVFKILNSKFGIRD